MRFPKLAAILSLAVIVFAACGGSSAATTGVAPTTGAGSTAAPTTAAAATPASGATQDPAVVGAQICGLLTAADVSGVTGMTYGAGIADAYGDCEWYVGGATTGGGLTAEFYGQSLSYVQSTYAGGVNVTVSGHPAYWQPEQGIGELFVDLGTHLFVIGYGGSAQDLTATDEMQVEALATIAIGKM